MKTDYFVEEKSIVRKIWGNGDTILFIFAGASAEFALNKAVDWLYFTGKLPQDPLGRLFSTVTYARKIVFSEKEAALNAIDAIAKIHTSVESKRGKKIPEWAYRDVLYMLIDYSIRSFELLERKLTLFEKQETYRVFYRVGTRMGLKELPKNLHEFEKSRYLHLQEHLIYGKYTRDLFKQYRKHLGLFRYRLLLETQNLICPKKVQQLMGFRRIPLLQPVLLLYKFSRSIKIDKLLKSLILPSEYIKEIQNLDQVPA